MNERDAEQAPPLAGAQPKIRRPAAVEGLVGREGNNRIQARVKPLDRLEEMPGEFEARDRSGSQAAGEFADR